MLKIYARVILQANRCGEKPLFSSELSAHILCTKVGKCVAQKTRPKMTNSGTEFVARLRS